MEESQEILLNSLKIFGIDVPSEISSVGEISPSTLFSICTQSLRRLSLSSGDDTTSFPTSLPDSMADRVRICSDVASSITNLGFVGDISFHKFLYPSEEDLYKLVRFLVKRLSETSEATEIAESQDVHVEAHNTDDSCESTSEVCSAKSASCQEGLEFSGNNDVGSAAKSQKEADVASEKSDQLTALGPCPDMLSITKDSYGNDDVRQPTETIRDLRQNDRQNEDTQGDIRDAPMFVKASNSIQKLSSEESETLKEARRKAFDGQDLVDFQHHDEQMDSASNPDALGKLQKLKDIELETESVLSEIRNREEECAKLTAELEKQPKVVSRRSYIERISEITKNSRKQNADIDRILKETRELQLESNSIEERLHRSYAVVDEMVLREAKKDIIGREAYRLLTSVHNSFEEIREKILETDRTRREGADIEGRLASIASRSLDMEKLQSDVDAIKRENESLDHPL